MTDGELDRQRAKEAHRVCGERWYDGGYSIAETAARLARENWLPPDPLEAEVDKLMPFVGIVGNPNQVRWAIKQALQRGAEMEREKKL